MPKHYLAVCAMHKLEAARLREWIEYHLLVGFEHVYLFDNNDSDDGSAAIVREYVQAGQATSFSVRPNRPGLQIELYEWLFRRQLSTWIAFIDIDEFIFPVAGNDVRPLLKPFERYAGLAVNWRCFGTSGHSTPPPLLTEAMIMASQPGFENNTHVKSIVRPERVIKCETPHHFIPVPGLQIVNENHIPVAGPFAPFTDSTMVVNHYMLRSEAEYRQKLIRGRGDMGVAYPQDYFEQMNRNDVPETRLADRFGAKVRERWDKARQGVAEV